MVLFGPLGIKIIFASKNLKKQEGEYFDTSFNYGLDLDKRNQRFQTTDGFQSKFTQKIPLISESDTLLNGYQFDTYHSYNDITASLGLYLRAVTGLSDDVRISERINLPRKRNADPHFQSLDSEIWLWQTQRS